MTRCRTDRVLWVFEERVDVLDQDVVLEPEHLDDLFRDPRLHDCHLFIEIDEVSEAEGAIV